MARFTKEFLQVLFDNENKETFVSGMGELHMEIGYANLRSNPEQLFIHLHHLLTLKV